MQDLPGYLSTLRLLASWRRAYRFVAVVGVVCVLTGILRAQEVDATDWQSGLVNLESGWRVHDGDDPGWAKADLDDSQWKQVDLDGMGAAEDGWTWYRIHVKLPPEHENVNLLIAGGTGTYELFLNGRRVEGARIRSFWNVGRPTEQVFRLSDQDNDLVIAIRMLGVPMYTGWHLPPFLTADVGTPGAIENKRAAMEALRLYSAVPSIAINIVVVLAGLGAFALFRSQPGHREYMWLALYLVLLGISNGLLYTSTSGIFVLAWNNLLADPLIYVVMIMQIEFTFSFAGRRPGKILRAYEFVLLLSIAVNPLSVIAGWIPANLYLSFEAILISPAALFLPVLLAIWYRKGNREAGWLILPSLLPAAAVAIFNIGSASIYTGFAKLDFLANPIPVGPVSLQLTDAGDFLFVLAIGVVMFFRFSRVSREQTRVTAELEAAREIQQRLVPSQLPAVKGYQIEAAYFPAQEVGGDFYQVLNQEDGAQIIVVGDVSGKGLKAAMTGTLALGALRTLAAAGLGPAEILNRLNHQLAKTGDGGFITCVCARLSPDGEITVANAGHLPPYRNGEEMPVCQDLPLGIDAGHEYEQLIFQLDPGDRLTLLSDGVLEARDARGALFGFERTRAISGGTAAAIAAEALRFGQEDDITVLTLARLSTAQMEVFLGQESLAAG